MGTACHLSQTRQFLYTFQILKRLIEETKQIFFFPAVMLCEEILVTFGTAMCPFIGPAHCPVTSSLTLIITYTYILVSVLCVC